MRPSGESLRICARRTAGCPWRRSIALPQWTTTGQRAGEAHYRIEAEGALVRPSTAAPRRQLSGAYRGAAERRMP
jgi:hypothetical protein